MFLFKRKNLLFFLLAALISFSIWFYYRCPVHIPDSQNIDVADYPAQLDSIKKIRYRLLSSNVNKDKLAKDFSEILTRRIFPYWYGTDWDFNGTTETPRKGKIACGYFVTTSLRDAGYPINRIKMAQCASEVMIKSLVQKKNIFHYPNTNAKSFEKKLMEKGEAIYVLGLDNHTGFIQISKQGNFFIHASGWYPYKVVREKLSESDVVSNSKYKVVGNLSSDEVFLQKWLKN